MAGNHETRLAKRVQQSSTGRAQAWPMLFMVLLAGVGVFAVATTAIAVRIGQGR